MSVCVLHCITGARILRAVSPNLMLSKVTRYNYGILLHIPICSIADELYDIEVILRGL